MRVRFLVHDLRRSGGVAVVLGHARRLAEHGFQSELVLTGSHAEVQPDAGVPVLRLAEAREPADLAIATWWETAPALWEQPAERRLVLLQGPELRFYGEDDLFLRLGAASLLTLPVDYLVVGSWLRELLAELRPDARVELVPNGVDKDRFAPGARGPRREGPLRVLVEGQPTLPFKGVDDALAAVRAASEPMEATVVTLEETQALEGVRSVSGLDPGEMARVYAEHDVLLKLSRFEGLSLPPLEAFHVGLPAVLTPYGGHADYLRHGENGLLVGFDDVGGTASTLDLLARDRGLLARLSEGALVTAGEWPSLDASSERLAEVLRSLAEAPEPDAEAAVPHALRALELGLRLGRRPLLDAARDATLLTEARARVAELEEQLETVLDSQAYRAALGARRILNRVLP